MPTARETPHLSLVITESHLRREICVDAFTEGRVLTVRGQDPGSWQRGPMA